jgi:hypothetical protein
MALLPPPPVCAARESGRRKENGARVYRGRAPAGFVPTKGAGNHRIHDPCNGRLRRLSADGLVLPQAGAERGPVQQPVGWLLGLRPMQRSAIGRGPVFTSGPKEKSNEQW